MASTKARVLKRDLPIHGLCADFTLPLPFSIPLNIICIAIAVLLTANIPRIEHVLTAAGLVVFS